MTDRQFLENQSRLVRHRLRQNTTALRQELETTVAPVVREHPRASVAAGAVAGFLLAGLVSPSPTADRPRRRRGPIAGSWAFIKETWVFALRSTLVDALMAPFSDEPPTA